MSGEYVVDGAALSQAAEDLTTTATSIGSLRLEDALGASQAGLAGTETAAAVQAVALMLSGAVAHYAARTSSVGSSAEMTVADYAVVDEDVMASIRRLAS